MNRFFTIFLSAVLLALVSCSKENVTSGGGSGSAVSVTGVASEITEVSARLSAYANLTADMSGEVTLGIIVSTSETPTAGNGNRYQSGELDGNNMYSIVATNLTPGTRYYFRSVLECHGLKYYGDVKSFTTLGGGVIPGPIIPVIEVAEKIDLGLPSGLKWASCNVGASKPEEYGDYFQWGGTTPVTSTSIYLDWSNCPYHTGSSYNSGWTKYIPSGKSSYWSGPGSPDNKTVLDPEDDAAHVQWGGSWRMPTASEIDELLNNCTSTWTTLNGVKGRKFTSKKNGNSIFLPAAGCRYGGSLGSAGSYGHYWSSSLNTDNPNDAWDLYFNSSSVLRSYGNRYLGLSVRPVSE